VQSGSSDLDALGIMVDEGESAAEILGLPLKASSAEVREAYIRLAKAYHPDTHPGDLAAERRFKRITKAYNELRSPFHVIGGAQTYRAPEFWGANRRMLAIAAMFFVLTPLAIFFVVRSEERSVASLEFRQAEGAALQEILEDGGATKAPPINYKRFADTSADGTFAARFSEEIAKDGRFRGSASFEAHPSQGADEANRSPEAAPQGQARMPGLQAPSPNDEFAVAPANDTVQPKDQNDQKKVASVQLGMQDNRGRAVDPQAPPYRNNPVAERAGKKLIVPLKTINTAATSIPGNKQGVRPERPVISARTALLEHSLDRIVVAAAPGG
jgi:curved DNA-binding protein CbpA